MTTPTVWVVEQRTPRGELWRPLIGDYYDNRTLANRMKRHADEVFPDCQHRVVPYRRSKVRA
jgi:hypothetical protein